MPPSAAGIARSLGKGQESGGLRSDIVTIALIPAGAQDCNFDSQPRLEPFNSGGLSWTTAHAARCMVLNAGRLRVAFAVCCVLLGIQAYPQINPQIQSRITE